MDEMMERYREELDRVRLTGESRAALIGVLARHVPGAAPAKPRHLRRALTAAALIAACLTLTAGGLIRLTGLPVYAVDYHDPRFSNLFYTVYTNGVVWLVELAPLSWGCIGLAALFAAQLALCCKARRKAVKCIPLYVIGLGLLFSAAVYAGLLGRSSAGDISGNQLAGVILAFIVGIAGLGVAAAWGVYGLVLLWRRMRRKR